TGGRAGDFREGHLEPTMSLVKCCFHIPRVRPSARLQLRFPVKLRKEPDQFSRRKGSLCENRIDLFRGEQKRFGGQKLIDQLPATFGTEQVDRNTQPPVQTID